MTIDAATGVGCILKQVGVGRVSTSPVLCITDGVPAGGSGNRAGGRSAE